MCIVPSFELFVQYSVWELTYVDMCSHGFCHFQNSWVYYRVFIRFPNSGYVKCFQFLAIKNSATVNTFIIHKQSVQSRDPAEKFAEQ